MCRNEMGGWGRFKNDGRWCNVTMCRSESSKVESLPQICLKLKLGNKLRSPVTQYELPSFIMTTTPMIIITTSIPMIIITIIVTARIISNKSVFG